jgi:glycosyltransferase involved in cell wall biosynthesis
MRILLVEPDLEDNGAMRVSLDRASRWAEMDADVSLLLVSSFSAGRKADLPSNLNVIVANSKLASARWMMPKALLKGMTAANRADVIVAGREIASGLLIGTLLAKLARRPLAVTVHNNVDAALEHHGTARHRRNVLACLRAADRLVPVSSGLKAGLLDMGLPASRIKVVENGLDADRLRVLAAEMPHFTMGETPLIFGLGRLTAQKGLDVLIRAHARALREGAPDHRVVIAGQGPDLGALQALAAELGVSGSVEFLGFRANPFPVLRQADLFALPSRWEGFALALAEAVILQVPSVASDCIAGPAEILEDGRFGDLVPVGDDSALAAAIAAHLKNPRRLRDAATLGSRNVESRFSAKNAAGRHLRLLQDLQASSPRAMSA